MSEEQRPAMEPPAPLAKSAWLCFNSEPWENCDRIIGRLEINGAPDKVIFNCVVPEVDGLVCESHSLSRIIQPWKELCDKYERALNDIRVLADWYAMTHQGPEHEVHHALKVEVLDIAQRALENG
jgi:hypothetical protein